MYREAIVLAGGMGSRLKSIVDDRPKSMALINGKPFLEYQLDYLNFWGIRKVILAVSYKREMIMNHFGDQYRDMSVTYSVEEEALGTGGAIRQAMELVEDFGAMVYNGDTMFRLNIEKFKMFNRQKMSKVTIALHEEEDASRYGSVLFDDDFRISGFIEKGIVKGKGFINGGVYFLRKDFFMGLDYPKKFSMEKDFFEKRVQDLEIYGMVCKQYFLDIGIPEDFERAQHEFKEFQY